MRRTALCVSMVMLLWPGESHGQWMQTDGPEGGMVRHLCATPTSILLALEGGGLYRTTNAGTNWTLLARSLSATADNYAGLAVVGTSVFLATSGGTIYRSTDDGLSWTASGSGLPTASVSFGALGAKGDTLVLMTSAGAYRSTNRGGAWALSTSGLPPKSIFSAILVHANRFLVGSDQGLGVYASIDGGGTWSKSSGGLAGDGLSVLCFADSGARVIAGTRQGAYWSTNHGETWTLCSRGMSAKTASALCAGAGKFYAGTYGDGIYHSSDGGVNWSSIGTGLTNGNIRALLPAGAKLFAGTYGPGVVYRSSNEGSTWTEAGKGIVCQGIYSLCGSGDRILAATFSGPVVTTDMGRHWQKSDSGMTGAIAYGFHLRAGDIVAATAPDGVYRTTNAGVRWYPVAKGLYGNARTAWSVTSEGTTIYAGTGSGVYRSTNGGTWVQKTAGIPDSLVRRIFAHNGSIYAGTTTGLYRSTNSGDSWTASTTGLPPVFQPEALTAADTFIVAGMLNGVYRTGNAGASWTTVSAGMPPSPDVRCLLEYQSPGGRALFAGLSHGGVYSSTNNGTSWVFAGTGLAGGIGVSSLTPYSGFLYAGTFAHGVWRRPLSELVANVEEPDVLPATYELLQNFPNPFNGISHITFSIPGPARVRLAVFDLLGREAAVLVDEWRQPGRHVVPCEAGCLASGVYVYRLVAGGWIAQKTLVVLR